MDVVALHTNFDSLTSSCFDPISSILYFYVIIHLSTSQVYSKFVTIIFLQRIKGNLFCRQRLLDAYDNDIWDAGRKIVSAIWDAIGWTWHGK